MIPYSSDYTARGLAFNLNVGLTYSSALVSHVTCVKEFFYFLLLLLSGNSFHCLI